MDEKLVLGQKKEKKLKENVLDESFKNAEISRGLKLPQKKTKKKTYEKTFPKFGILLIIIAIIGLICIYNVPWAYVKFNPENEPVESLIYKNFEGDNVENQQILDMFQKPYYIGVSVDDFTVGPESATYGFIMLIVLGMLITLFGLIDKKRDFSSEISVTIHLIFSGITILPGMFIVLSSLKFIGAHFLLFYNMPLTTSLSNVILFFPAAFVVIISGFIIIKLAFTVLRMDFNEMKKIIEIGKSEQSFPDYVYGGGSK